MYCPRCGRTASGDQHYCRSCGLHLQAHAQLLVAEMPAGEADELRCIELHRERAKRWSHYALVGSGAAALLAFVWTIVFRVIARGAVFPGFLVLLILLGLTLYWWFQFSAQRLRDAAARQRRSSTDVTSAPGHMSRLPTETSSSAVPSVTEPTTDLLRAPREPTDDSDTAGKRTGY